MALFGGDTLDSRNAGWPDTLTPDSLADGASDESVVDGAVGMAA